MIFGSGGEFRQTQIVRDPQCFRISECFREKQFSLVLGIKGNQAGIERAVKIRCEQETVLRVQPFGIVCNAPRLDVLGEKHLRIVIARHRASSLPESNQFRTITSLTDARGNDGRAYRGR